MGRGDKLDSYNRLAQLDQQLRDVRDRVFEMLDDLNAVEIMRKHVPAHHRWLFDRLDSALRRIDLLDGAIAEAEYEAEYEAERELEDDTDDSPGRVMGNQPAQGERLNEGR